MYIYYIYIGVNMASNYDFRYVYEEVTELN